MGVIKTLIENECMPSIVTGTSGGAIIAGMLAISSDEEMLDKVIQPDIAVRYPERWFPPMEQQLFNYVRNGCLVEHDEFANCCRRYYGDVTFEEAFARTGRIANINISVGARQGGVGKKALLLNHLTAPHVLIRSAVHASCALPTVMHPTKLLMKGANGQIEQFEKESLEFIDGSFTADIPRRRLSELFHVTQDIVSQVNPHVVAMLHSRQPGASAAYSPLHRVQQHFLGDVLHRLKYLARLRLLPAMYGQDITAAMEQRYTGDVTIVPRVGGPYAIIKMVQNPSRAMMTRYIAEGQRATFLRLSHIRHLLSLEQALEAGLATLHAERRKLEALGILPPSDPRTPSAGQLRSGTAPAPLLRRSLSLPLGRETREARQRATAEAVAMVPASVGSGGVPRLATWSGPSPPPHPTLSDAPAAAAPSRALGRAHRRAVSHASRLDDWPSAGGAQGIGAQGIGAQGIGAQGVAGTAEAEPTDPRHGRWLSTLVDSPSAEAADGSSEPSPTLRLPAAVAPTPPNPRQTRASPHAANCERESGSPTRERAPNSAGGAADDDARSKRLLSESIKHTKALQQLTRDKAAMQKVLDEQADLLRSTEAARERAERRSAVLEATLRTIQSAASSSLCSTDHSTEVPAR